MTGTAPDVLPDWLAHDSARTWREPGGSVTSGDSVGGPRVADSGRRRCAPGRRAGW